MATPNAPSTSPARQVENISASTIAKSNDPSVETQPLHHESEANSASMVASNDQADKNATLPQTEMQNSPNEGHAVDDPLSPSDFKKAEEALPAKPTEKKSACTEEISINCHNFQLSGLFTKQATKHAVYSKAVVRALEGTSLPPIKYNDVLFMRPAGTLLEMGANFAVDGAKYTELGNKIMVGFGFIGSSNSPKSSKVILLHETLD